jgi:hypothetical protein
LKRTDGIRANCLGKARGFGRRDLRHDLRKAALFSFIGGRRLFKLIPQFCRAAKWRPPPWSGLVAVDADVARPSRADRRSIKDGAC